MNAPMAPPSPPRAPATAGSVPALRTYGRRHACKRSRAEADSITDGDADDAGLHERGDGQKNENDHGNKLDPAARLSLRRALLGIPSSPPSPSPAPSPPPSPVVSQSQSSSSWQQMPSSMVAQAASTETNHLPNTATNKKQRTQAAARTKGPLDAFFLVRKPSPAAPLSASSSVFSPNPKLSSSSSVISASAPKSLIQTRLNFGQRNQGAQHCPDCGMHYLPMLESDRKLHAKFHKASQLGIEYPGYRADILLATHPTLRIVYHDPFPVTAAPAKPVHAKLAHIHAHVDAALGAAPTDSSSTCTYLALGPGGRRVLGVLVMDALPVSAWRVTIHNQPVHLDTPDIPEGAWGVSRIWVHAAHARRGVATRLLAAMADKLGVTAGERAAKVAFSQPTEAGWALAKTWVGAEKVLVYY